MIKFNKVINRNEIIYTFDNISIVVRRNPKLEIEISSIIGVDEKSLELYLSMVIKDINSCEPTCISFNNNLQDSISFIIRINSLYSNVIFKVREDMLENVSNHLNDIILNRLPIVINYVISSSETSLESALRVLKELDELYIIDEEIKSRFNSYLRNINRIYLTKELEEGISDDPFERATFMYYLDRFGFKVNFDGKKELIESWKNSIREYYQNTYFISKKRSLKVIQ